MVFEKGKKVRVKQLDKGKNISRSNIKWENILFNENVRCLFCLSCRFFEKKPSPKCAVICTVFWTKNIPSVPYVSMVWPSEATTDTMQITGIPTHNTLFAKTESLKCIIEGFKVSVNREMKGLLKDELDTREIGGMVFIQENLILSKLDEIISQNKVTTN